MSDMKKDFPYWLALEDGKSVRFADLAHMMAKAMYPSDADVLMHGATRVNLEGQLAEAVASRTLCVRNPAGMEPYTFAVGDALNRTVLMLHDIQPFLAARGIGIRIIPYGSGPALWTLENAAADLAAQQGWHSAARATFQDQMLDAANNRELVVRHPHTDLPKNSGPVRAFDELVTPADVNAWLGKQGVAYRWTAAFEQSSVAHNSNGGETSAVLNDDENKPAQGVPKVQGRPRSNEKKAAIVGKLIEAMTVGETFTASALPGSIVDLLSVCKKVESALTKKATNFGGATPETFNRWLKLAGYGMKPGRTLKAEKKYWTSLLPKVMAKIPPKVFV